MTSTSVSGFMNAYRDRRGIALMRFSLPENTPCCINISNSLPYYSKQEEAEVLLPPFMKLDIEEIPMTQKETEITDYDGKPPYVSCTVKTAGIEKYSGNIPVLSYDGSEAGQRIYNALNNNELPNKSDIELYSCWKSDLQKILHSMLA